MAHYLIYIPRQHFDAAEKAGQHPLDYVGLSAFHAGAFSLQVGDGPDGTGGQLYSWAVATATRRMHYNADEQDWLPAVPDPVTEAAARRYWCGLWKESPVTPRDILRTRTTPGIELPIGQHSWRIPAADLLPAVAAFSTTGQWVTEVEPAFREYWSAVETMRATLAAGHDEMEIASLFEFCLQVLSVNYRLTREVLQHLQVLSTETAPRILRQAIGLPAEPEMMGV